MAEKVTASLAKNEQLAVRDSRDLIKAIAMDIGKEVAHHIETMYPEAVRAASSTFLLSVRNCTSNQIVAAVQAGDIDPAEWIRRREKFRRHIKAAYKKIRGGHASTSSEKERKRE